MGRPLGTAEIDYNEIAESLGYNSEKEMYIDLYYKKKWGVLRIRKFLGYTMVNLRMINIYKMKLRPRGGPNNKGKELESSLKNRILRYGPHRLKDLGSRQICEIFGYSQHYFIYVARIMGLEYNKHSR